MKMLRLQYALIGKQVKYLYGPAAVKWSDFVNHCPSIGWEGEETLKLSRKTCLSVRHGTFTENERCYMLIQVM